MCGGPTFGRGPKNSLPITRAELIRRWSCPPSRSKSAHAPPTRQALGPSHAWMGMAHRALEPSDAPALDLLAAIAAKGRSSRPGLRNPGKPKSCLPRLRLGHSHPARPAFSASAPCSIRRTSALALALEREIKRTSTTPSVFERDRKARRQMLTGTLTAIPDDARPGRPIASGRIYAGTPVFFQVYLQRLRDVTPASLAGVVHRYLTPDNLTKAVLMPGRRATDDGQQRSEIKNPANQERYSENDSCPTAWSC